MKPRINALLLLILSTTSAWVQPLRPLTSVRSPAWPLLSSVEPIATFGDATLSELSFGELYPDDIPDWLLERSSSCGWKYPTIIQERAMNSILGGNDVVLQSQTGSGKTLAYLLPLLSKIQPNRAAIQGVVIVPTRELGLQVSRVAKRLTAGQTGIMVMSVLQGSQNKRQRAWAWSEPPQLVIGTPQELTNMVKFGGIKYNSVKYVVVDEVDACLLNNSGQFQLSSSGALHELLSRYLSPTYEEAPPPEFQETTIKLETSTPRRLNSRQTVFCSATLPQHRHFMQQCVSNQWTTSKDPVYVCASPGDLLPPTLTHGYMVCASQEKKFSALRRLLKKLAAKKRILVFCDPNRPMMEMAQVLAEELNGIVWQEHFGEEQEGDTEAIVSVLNFDDSLSQRASAMLGFQGLDGGRVEGRRFEEEEKEDSTLRIMFSTDLAARGLDVQDVSHIIQFDLPRDGDTYVHRSGRAGRLGRSGKVISIITPQQEFVLDRLSNKLNLDLKCLARQQGNKKA